MAITLTPSVASPRAKIDAVRVDVAGASANDVADYDANDYPSRAAIKLYLAFVLGGEDLGKSYVFTVGEDGAHEFNNYIFPDDGSWTMELRRADTDAVLKSQSITVT